MPTPVPTRFTKFDFTQEEFYAATRFTQVQLMLLQTLIADAAVRKTNLKFDPQDTVNFAQQEAEITGEIGAYEHLFLLATEMEMPEAQAAAELAEVTAKSQPNPQT